MRLSHVSKDPYCQHQRERATQSLTGSVVLEEELHPRITSGIDRTFALLFHSLIPFDKNVS